jgi:hypothetical protein
VILLPVSRLRLMPTEKGLGYQYCHSEGAKRPKNLKNPRFGAALRMTEISFAECLKIAQPLKAALQPLKYIRKKTHVTI